MKKILANAMNAVLGTKFKMVLGYKDSASVDLCDRARRGAGAQRHDADRRQAGAAALDHREKVIMLVQTGSEREADFPTCR